MTISSMRLTDGSAPKRSLSSARIADSENPALPVTLILVIRFTGINCQRSATP